MRRFMEVLSGHGFSPAVRHAIPVVAVAAATLLRFLAPLDTAPFLLYLPIVFLVALALGRGPGVLAVAASLLAAAWFFRRSDDTVGLNPGQIVALAQYLVVGLGMVWVCDALRRSMVEREEVLGRIDAANAGLRASQAALEDARRDAEAAREAAEDANRAKSSFLANMSHELRTPLSAVIGYSEMLEEEAEELGQDGLLKDLGKIKSNAKHLLGLINDVLDLSKVEADKMETYAEDIDVEAFVRDAAGTVEALVAKKGNRLVLNMGDGLAVARTDATKLRQCLFNLLSNAAKFTEAGTITLRVHREADANGDRLVLSVQDTGIGMSPEQVDRLFQRFVQADGSTTRKYGGTGLGLALTKAFAQLLGGDVTVTSEIGHGTRFTLVVPATLPEPDGPNVIEGPASDGAAGPGARGLVLVIDDEASQRDLMGRFLTRQGFSVRTAGDGRTGLDLARSLSPRVILLDVMMPEVDGWTVLTTLKGDPATQNIPVVMVSFVADAALSASLGAADAVPKPVDWARLKGVLDRLGAGAGDVLVVDDDAEMRERLRTVLERNGWSVREAGDGAEALDKVREATPRLVLLDLTMPVMDGFSFLHRLRGMPGCAEIPVVVLSAREVTIAERRQLADADRVLRKGDASLQDIATELRKLDDRQREGVDAAPSTEA
ncbi:hybrid sensor histidine kinase/response regulator [Methylobacterium sp. J-092]|uniref:hybrid sensor histidine kinase/response regulator n=1 Tax=Methylobacterium sp. J-092 TaxID=2836667 RepID=UPI001FBA2900|nr:response regulator [Methylobacterium sp. J-092]MCJ2009533.1 response regulator [Methylobacterium sp. J-092]